MCMPLFLGSIASILMDTENIINNPECTDENTNLNNLNKVKCDFFAPFLVKVCKHICQCEISFEMSRQSLRTAQ